MKLYRAGFLLLLVVVATSASGLIILLPYYRWASAPAATCVTDSANPHLELANQPEEWAFIAPDDRAQLHFTTNGADDFLGSLYDPPDGTSSGTYAPFSGDEAPYPFTYSLRWVTVRDGQTTYHSALTATCTGDGTPTAAVVNWYPGASSSYYRWSYAPDVDCIDNGGSKLLRFVIQPVQWRNLPPAAEYQIVYSENGTENLSGPFAAPDGDGSTLYGALGTTNATYPIHYAVRRDTLVAGKVVYQSFLLGDCEADGPGRSWLVNVPEPAGASIAAFGALGALAGRRRRARR